MPSIMITANILAAVPVDEKAFDESLLVNRDELMEERKRRTGHYYH